MQSTLYSCPILMNLDISRQFFEKYSNIKFDLLHVYLRLYEEGFISKEKGVFRYIP